MANVPSDTIPELFRLDRPKTVVGRASQADLRLPHPAISRRHAEVILQGDRVSVRDLGSRSGVMVNHRLVKQSEVRPDDVLAFGPIAYELKGTQLHRLTSLCGIQVEARNLSCRRGNSLVLADVNLTIPPNNFVGIIGPSGAGKTTLLKSFTGYLPLETGNVFFDGMDVNEHGEVCRSLLGYVPQDDLLQLSLSARENLDYALQLRVFADLRSAERAGWVIQTLQRLGLEANADRPVRTLSGGERKRVSVALELLTRPRLLLLDEPTAGLDPAVEARLMQFLHEQAHRGMTVICTTHVLESLTLFDAVMVVAGGRLLGSGKPANLLKHFQCGTYAELYEKLKERPAAAPASKIPAVNKAAAPPAVHHGRASLVSQIGTLLRRNAHVVVRDRVFLALLVGQPLLIGLLINLSQWNPNTNKMLDPMLTFAVIGCIWLGMNNTAREIIRDRAGYVRERRTALTSESYILAKTFFFAAIGLGQVCLLALVLRYCNFWPMFGASDPDIAKALHDLQLGRFVLVLWLTYLSSMFLGMLISSMASTEEVAIAALPLVILPQLLLTAVATDSMRSDPPQTGYMNSLPVLLERAPKDPYSAAGWVCEVASLVTYSRPALVLLMTKFQVQEAASVGPGVKAIIDWSHLLVLLLATATAFAAVFLARERRWLEAG